MKSFFEKFSGTGYVCAHRGARSIAPENTPLAFEKARLCGADLWETDVQATADGELVLFHDHTLARTTDIATLSEFSGRSPWALEDYSYAELQKLNAGAWFLQSDPFATVAAGEIPTEDAQSIRAQRIPLLREILADCQRYNDPLNLEIKDQSGTAADGTIVAQVMELIELTQTQPLVLISSFNHDYLCQVKQLNGAVSTAALVEYRHPEPLLSYLRDLGVDAYHPDQSITDTALVRQLVNDGMRVNLWTVNDPEQVREYTAAGATFICTDWPQRMVSISHS